MPPKKTPNPVKKPRVVKVVSFENEEPASQPSSSSEKPEAEKVAKTPKPIMNKPLEEGAPKKPRKPRAKKSPNTLKKAREARKAVKAADAAVLTTEAPVSFPTLTVDDIRKSNEESTRSMYEMIKQDMSKRFDNLREDLSKRFSAVVPTAPAPKLKRRMNCPPIETYSDPDSDEAVGVDFNEEQEEDHDDDDDSFYREVESSFRDDAGDMALKILGRRR